MNQGRAQFLQFQEELASCEAQIIEARAWAVMRTSDGWPAMEAWLRAQQAARHQQILLGESAPDRERYIELRAEYRLLDRLLKAGRDCQERIEALESRSKDLRAKIEKLKLMGQDRDFSVR